MNVSVAPSSSALSQARPITVAVLAMGGQGGGVLVDWIVALAERRGWFAQSTSVPGVGFGLQHSGEQALDLDDGRWRLLA